jgi:hypothetical protein
MAEGRSTSATVLWLRQCLACGRDSLFAVFGRRSGCRCCNTSLQEVMTHIDVGDNNSTPEQLNAGAKHGARGYSRTLTGLLSLADFAAADAVRSLVSGLRSGPSLHRLPVIRSLGAARLGLQLPGSSLGSVADFYLRNSLSTTGCCLDACRRESSQPKLVRCSGIFIPC